jgi:acetyl-CoA C-acetyltransferase
MRKSVIIAAKRIPIGSSNGSLSNLSATQSESIVIQSPLNEINLPSDEINKVLLVNILSARLRQAPARQADLGAGLHDNIE